MLHKHEKTESSSVKRQYQSPQLYCYGALTELTQTGSGTMPENTSSCTAAFTKSGKSFK